MSNESKSPGKFNLQEIEKSTPEDWEESAECFYDRDWKRLIEINESQMRNEPDSEFLLWETADAYINLGEYEKALEFGNKIRASYPDSPNAGSIIKRAKKN